MILLIRIGALSFRNGKVYTVVFYVSGKLFHVIGYSEILKQFFFIFRFKVYIVDSVNIQFRK